MKTSLLSGVAVAAVLAFGVDSASASFVSIWETSTPNLAIPDSDPAGVTDTLNIGSSGAIQDIEIEVAIDHTWIGDLIFTLEGPDGTTITLMDQPGTPPGTSGDPSDLSSSFPIMFVDGAAIAAEDAGCADTNKTIGSDCDTPPIYDPDQSLLTAFQNKDIFGDWMLTISDNTSGDFGGILASWTVHAYIGDPRQQVPEPGTLTLFGIGLAGLSIMRRRRRA